MTVAAVQTHLRSHDSCAEPGWSVCMHVAGVEATKASMIVALRPDAAPLVWALTGHPCSRDYRAFAFDDAATTDLATI